MCIENDQDWFGPDTPGLNDESRRVVAALAEKGVRIRIGGGEMHGSAYSFAEIEIDGADIGAIELKD